MKVLLILALASLACGLQPSMRYEYQYLGSTHTGIPEISSQGSSVAMRANLTIEMDNEGSAIVTLSQTEFAELNGELGCDWRSDIAYHFAPLEQRNLVDLLERPFKANLFGNGEAKVTLQQEEPIWMTNVRKGVLAMVRNQLTQSNFPGNQVSQILTRQGEFKRSFEISEETLVGECNVQYTVHPIPEIMVSSTVMTPEEMPAQPSSLSWRQSQSQSQSSTPNQIWHVTRTIDFEHCSERVELQRSSGGVSGTLGNGQYKWLGGRSSVSEYVMKGAKGEFQIEKASVEGMLTVNALGHTEEHIQSRTNQTLRLISARPNTRPTQLSAAVQESKTWLQEVMTPIETPTVSPQLPWVKYTANASLLDTVEMMTGISESPENLKTRQEEIRSHLKEAAEAMTAQQPDSQEQSGDILDKLRESSLLMEALPRAMIKDIVDDILSGPEETPSQKMIKKLVIDVVSVAGTRPAIELLVEMASEKRISDMQLFTISFTIVQTMQDVTVIPDIMNLVTSIDIKEKPLVASTALVNFARIAQRFCLDPNATSVNYAGQLYGDSVCDKDLIIQEFVPFLENIIKNEDLEFERVVALQTLHKLGLPLALNTLAPVALGQLGRSTLLRTSAIYALDRWCLPSESRAEVMELLSQIYSNVAESPRVRVAAVSVFATWGPSISFWHKIARQSWREPSMAMAAVYKALIEQYATSIHPEFMEQSQAASSALKLIRPIVPSGKYPNFMRDIAYIMESHIARAEESSRAFYDHPVRSTNFDILAFAMTSVNGFDLNSLESLILGGSLKPMRQPAHQQYPQTDANQGSAEDFFQLIQETVQANPKMNYAMKDKLISVYIRLIENMQVLAPVSVETLKTLPIADPRVLAQFLKDAQKGTDLLLGKFLVPITLKQFYPNELGLPVLVEHYNSVALSHLVKLQGIISSSSEDLLQHIPQKVHATAEQYFKLMAQTVGEIQVFVPWSNSKLRTAVKCSRDVTLPVLTSIDVDIESMLAKGVSPNHFAVSVAPAFDSKFSVINANNKPRVSIEQLSRSGPSRSPLIQTVVNTQIQNKTVQMPSTYSGLKFGIHWSSDLRYPLDVLSLKYLLRSPRQLNAVPKLYSILSSPTAHMWTAQLQFDPAQSPTKNVSLLATCDTAYSQSSSSSTSQQQSSSHSSSYHFAEGFGQISGSPKTRHCNSTLSFLGQENRIYEVVYTWAAPTYDSKIKQTKAQLAFSRSPIPNVDSESLMVCMDFKKSSPIISELDTVESILSKDLNAKFEKSIRVGCDDSEPAFSMESKLRISPERQQILAEQTQQSCQRDGNDPIHTMLKLAVYDDVQTSLKWKDICEKTRMPVITKLMTALDFVFMRQLETLACDQHQSEVNHMKMTFIRSLDTNRWDMQVEKESQRFIVESVPSSPLIDFGLAVRTIANPIESSQLYVKEAGVSDKCIIAKDHVRTFDGVSFNYTDSSCWTIAASECVTEQFVVYVRSSESREHPVEVRIVDRKEGVVAEISDHVKINGERVEPLQFVEKVMSGDKVLAEVSKQDGHYMVALPGRPLVAVKNTVEIRILGNQEICGVCGDKNSEKGLELIGPQHCIYTDAELFVTSWTGPGDKCDVQALQQRRQKVDQFQRGCETLDNHSPAQDLPYPVPSHRYSWPIVQQDDMVCSSRQPIDQCRSSAMRVDMNCWSKDRAPAALIKALERSRVQLPSPVSAQPQKVLSLTLPSAQC